MVDVLGIRSHRLLVK